jgi:hypothetical protein
VPSCSCCASGIGIATNLACFSPEFGGNLPLPPVELLANVFYIATASVPTILTSMICFKLLLHRHRMSKQCSTLRDSSKVYLFLVAIIVESAAPYVVCSWIWVALTITDNPAIDWFQGVFTATSVCSFVTGPVDECSRFHSFWLKLASFCASRWVTRIPEFSLCRRRRLGASPLMSWSDSLSPSAGVGAGPVGYDVGLVPALVRMSLLVPALVRRGFVACACVRRRVRLSFRYALPEL